MTPTPAQIEAAKQAYAKIVRYASDNYAGVHLVDHERALIAALTAAAEVGPQGKGPWVSSECWNSERNATIERCAKVAETYSTPNAYDARAIAAAIRRLRDSPDVDPGKR